MNHRTAVPSHIRRSSRKGVPPISGALWRAVALAVLYFSLVALSIVFAHATGPPQAGFPSENDVRHLLRVAVALFLAGIALCPHWRFFERWAYGAYACALLSLCAVLLLGPSIRSTRRWLALGPFRFQVSELAKVALICALARFLSRRRRASETRVLLGAGLWALPPIALIAAEPDLGTALLLLPVTGGLLFCAGARPKHLALLTALGISCAPFLCDWVLKPYQKRRLRSFLSAEASRLDPDAVLQRERALEAIGTGGVFGKGLGEGDRSLPVRHSDFIFAVVAEESGFAGAAVVLLLYALLLWHCFQIGSTTYDLFARYTAVGVGLLLGTQSVVAVAMTLGLLPVTGLNLPLLSRGGSSLLATSFALGIVANIALRPPRNLARKLRYKDTRPLLPHPPEGNDNSAPPGGQP